MYGNDFLLFLFLKVYFICCCSIINLWFLSLHIIYIKSLNSFKQSGEIPDWISKLKVHWANSQTISSHPVRFSTDIIFSLFCFLPSCFFLFVFKLKIYILIRIRLCGGVVDRKKFTWPISRNNTTFFGLNAMSAKTA